MKFNLIMAVDFADNIGKGDGLPWKQKADMIRFVELTDGHTVVMGRKTFESIGKKLPNRINLVVTSEPEKMEEKYGDQGLSLIFLNFESLKEFLDTTSFTKDKVFFIGGRSIWEWAFENGYAECVYLTTVCNARVDLGDIKYPEISERIKEYDVVYDLFATQDKDNDFNCRFYKLKL